MRQGAAVVILVVITATAGAQAMAPRFETGVAQSLLVSSPFGCATVSVL